jgi:hypothetical protein
LLSPFFTTDEEDEHRWDGFLNGTNPSSTSKSHLHHLHLWFFFPSLIAVHPLPHDAMALTIGHLTSL